MATRASAERREPARELAAAAREGVSARAAQDRLIAGDPPRGLAAVSVVLYHAWLGSVYAKPFGAPADISGLGDRVLINFSLGLYIFFVLSGYLIARPFVRAFVASESMPDVGRYLRNRALRVVPAF